MLSDLRAPSDGPQLVHQPMHRAWLLFGSWTMTSVVAVTVCFVLGCKEDEATPTVRAENLPARRAQATGQGTRDAAQQKLVGIWLGTTCFDENKLAMRLKGFPQDEVDEIIRKAQYFSNTLMAIDFKAGGRLENEIEIAPPGTEPIRQTGEGSWYVVEIRDDAVVVEIGEENSDGSITTSRKAYKFYEDGNHFAVSIELDDLLGECNPQIVFERQNLDAVLAEAPSATQRK